MTMQTCPVVAHKRLVAMVAPGMASKIINVGIVVVSLSSIQPEKPLPRSSMS
jgi:hypothetical protein